MFTEYARRITAEYNTHIVWLRTGDIGKMAEYSFHAFMANAIAGAVLESSHDEVKRFFNDNALAS